MSGRLILRIALFLSIVTSVMCQVIRVPIDYSTIQEAIISATNGDTVQVSPGTYNESINFLGKEITVRGENRHNTVIDGGGSVCVTNPFYLEELTIRNGSPGILGNDVSARVGTIRNCIVEANYFGLDAWGSYDIINSIFRNNSGYLGAAVRWSEGGYGELNITNTAFISNECPNYPALYKATNNGAFVNITNCTIAGNRATQQEVLHGNGINIQNTIIYHNILDNYPQLLMQGEINVTYSDLQVDFPGTGNINSDPHFADLDSENLQLMSSSPCVDAGNPSSPLDPDGTRMDMGAFYYHQIQLYEGPVWHVSTVGSNDTGNGSPGYPFATIQFGIDVSLDGDTILVQPGTYVENINFNGKNIVVSSLEITTGDTSYISATIIDGNSSGSVVTIRSGETNACELNGFVIRDGLSFGGDGLNDGYGGGIFINNYSSPILDNLIVEYNESNHEGGGILIDRSSPIVRNSIIRGNIGCGIAILTTSNPLIEGCIITDNTDMWGAGIKIAGQGGTSEIRHTLISKNIAVQYGGGLYASGTVENPSLINLVNVTIINNEAPVFGGGGILGAMEAEINAVNSILWGNLPDQIFQDHSSSVVNVSYSDVQSGWTGIGNIDTDPCFIDTSEKNYHLRSWSPSIDAGNPDANGDSQTWITDPQDQDPDGTRFDMGAFYHHQNFPTEAPPDTLWSRQFRSEGDNTPDAGRIIKTSDNCLLVSGKINDGELFLAKYTMAGTEVWYKTFNGEVNPQYQSSICETNTGEIYLFSSIDSSEINGRDLSLIKIDSDGEQLWNNSYGGIEAEDAIDLIIEEGSLTLLYGVFASGNLTDLGVMKLDLEGTVIWSKTHGGERNEYGESFIKSIDGGYTVLANVDSVEGENYSFQPLILKLNNDGDMVWQKTFPIPNFGWAGDILQNADGSYIMCCTIQGIGGTGYGCLIKFDDTGNLVWDELIRSEEWTELHSLTASTDGSITTAGLVSDVFANNCQTIIRKTDPSGHPIWERRGLVSGQNVGRDIITLTDESLFAIGELWSPDWGVWISRIGGEIDITPPSVELHTPDTLITGEETQLTWLAEDNAGFRSHHLYFSSAAGQEFAFVDSVGGSLAEYEWAVPNVITETARLSIMSYNYDGVTASDTTGVFTITGGITPPLAHLWHVSTTGSDETGDGSIESPYATIQFGIDESQNGDTVLVQPGTYLENINYNGKNIVVGSQTLTTSDTSWIHQTIIDGNNLDRVVTFNSGEDSTATLFGFTITNGLGSYGGGIYLDNSSSPLISNTHITGNSADHGGGIFADHDTKATLFRCLISENEATDESGGGIFCWLNSDLTIIECEIAQNLAVRGAGLYCTEATPSFIKTTIHDNIASNYGGGLVFHGTEGVASALTNLTIYNNQATNYGGGVVSTDHTGILAISNTIIWSNTPDQISVTEGSVTVEYSDVQSGWTGAGNIDLDPLMVDPESNDYHLNFNSPCIDSGDPDAQLDPDGTRADIGAFYFDQSMLYPQISVSPDSLEFSIVTDISIEQSLTITISNTGLTPLEATIYPSRVVTDVDGNTYRTTVIGDQVWMAENLKVTHYNNEIVIPMSSTADDWTSTSGVYCYYNYNASSESDIYGALYNWYAVTDNSILAPEGWHIPTTAEFLALEDYLGGNESGAGGKLKELGFTHWNSPNTGATNETGFSGLPGGQQHYDGEYFRDLGSTAYFWTSSEGDGANAWNHRLISTSPYISSYQSYMTYGFSIRCLRDLPYGSLHHETLHRSVSPERFFISPDTLTIQPGGSNDITITFNAEDLELGDYSGVITIISNDTTNGTLEIPMRMSISREDTIPPEIQLNVPDITSPILTGDSLSVTWEASDNGALDWAKLFFTADGGTYSLYDSVDANLGGLEWIAPDVISNSCNFAIWVSDLAGNVSADTLAGSFSIIDATPPLISILSPTQTTSVRENDSLVVSWEVQDNVGIDYVEIWYSRNPPSEPYIGIANITDGSTSYSARIRTGVTDNARFKMLAQDHSGNDGFDESESFSVTDGTRPVISDLSIPDTASFGIGSGMEIMVNATDNVKVTGLDLNYSPDAGTTWIPIVQGLYPVQEHTSYDWLIPDIPGTCQIQAIVTDAVGLTDSAYSSIFSIIVEYPLLIASLPKIAPWGDLHLSFSQVMDSLDISLGTQVTGSVGGAYEIDGAFSGPEVIISAREGFVSLDTLMIVLSASEWTNTFGYGLDGNRDGVYGGNSIDNDTAYTIVSAAGDYNQDDAFNFDDFSEFVVAWHANEYRYELAPNTHAIPNISIQPDSLFNIFDLATFASMWNWSAGVSLSAPLTESYQYEEFVSEQVGNVLTVALPGDDYLASQIIIKYDPSLVSISLADQGLAKVSSNGLSLVDTNPDSGFILITSSQLNKSGENPLQLTLAPSTRQRYSIEVAIQGSDVDANVVQKRSLVELLPIPTSFSLSQNYPNPFNANTTIEYGLPKDSDLSISIYDIRGRFVRDIYSGEKQAGYHVTHWNGSNDAGQNVASGLYFIVLHTPEYRVACKALILK